MPDVPTVGPRRVPDEGGVVFAGRGPELDNHGNDRVVRLDPGLERDVADEADVAGMEDGAVGVGVVVREARGREGLEVAVSQRK